MAHKKTESHRKTWRLMNPDGSFNIERVDHHRGAKKRDYYHRLLTMRWKAFMAYLIGVYFGTNVIFTGIYFVLGPHALTPIDGSSPTTLIERLGECFFFSVDVFATIGSGTVVPHGALANLVVTINALSGLLYIALLTGVFFARFSRPTAKVIFSDKAIIQTIDGIPCLMLRFANLRANQIIEAQVTMTYARNEVTAEGERFRNFGTLNLETNRSSMFVLSWTVVHPIDPSSPLYGLSQKDLLANEAEIFVVMTGWDETFAQTIHARRSYGPDEIFWNYRYEDMAERTPDNRCLILDIRKINNVAPV